jgi:hypothetical protein
MRGGIARAIGEDTGLKVVKMEPSSAAQQPAVSAAPAANPFAALSNAPANVTAAGAAAAAPPTAAAARRRAAVQAAASGAATIVVRGAATLAAAAAAAVAVVL